MNDQLQHHGILGQKWGVRRFQPYSLVPRKSGEGGKEVGQAKKSNIYKTGKYEKSERLVKKADKAYNKNKIEKGEKLLNKANELRKQDAKELQDNINKSLNSYKYLKINSPQSKYFINIAEQNIGTYLTYAQNHIVSFDMNTQSYHIIPNTVTAVKNERN